MITNEDKINIVTQHIKNVEINKYNIELSLIEANAKLTPDQSAIDSLNLQLDDLSAQGIALQAELAVLQAGA